MNVIDKLVSTFAPVHGMKRMAARRSMEFLNTGYSEGGASYTKKSMKGFTGISASPHYDIEANSRTLVNRSRLLYMTSPMATGAIKRMRTNVVGSGLRLKARIDYEYLGISEEEAEKWEGAAEREFDLWASTKLCDALRLNTFYEMQGLVFLGQMLNGDGFCLLKQEKPQQFMPYGLRLHLIEADRVCTPYQWSMPAGNSYGPYWGKNPDNGNEIYSGVEINSDGAVVAYWVCNQYPYVMTSLNSSSIDWKRVEAWGPKTGRPNILHLFEAERAEQRRGVPVLAPVIEELKQLKRYTDAELMAAVISGMFTVFVKSSGPSSDNPFGAAVPDDAQAVQHDDTQYELAPGAVVTLGENESIEIADPKRPNTAFDGFVDSLCKNIGAALEIPKEMLLLSFNSSYSASRAALLEAWKMFRMRREWLSSEFCQPVYELFLTEAVASGRLKAPGFFTEPLVRRAWCGADWNGAAQGMIDPVKEVNAAAKRVEEGFSTREEETIGLTGGNYKKNIKQLKRENRDLAQAKEGLGNGVIGSAKANAKPSSTE